MFKCNIDYFFINIKKNNIIYNLLLKQCIMYMKNIKNQDYEKKIMIQYTMTLTLADFD